MADVKTDGSSKAGNSDNPQESLVIGDGGNHKVVGQPSFLKGDVPDCSMDWGALDGIQVRAASVRGRIHRFEGTVRQDSFYMGSVAVSEKTFLLLSVADGVGSLPLSHVAAEAAARAAVNFFSDRLSRNDGELEELDSELREYVEEAILEKGRETLANLELTLEEAGQSMKTTLSVAIVEVGLNSEGEHRCSVYAMGDTSAWALRKPNAWELITRQKGEGADVFSSQVEALPTSSGRQFDEFQCSINPGEAFFLMSDGIGDPLGDGSGPVGETLSEKLLNPPDIYSFARICDFARRSHMDDRTLVGIWLPQ